MLEISGFDMVYRVFFPIFEKICDNLLPVPFYKPILTYIQSTLVISTSIISNNRLYRIENLFLLLM